MGLNRVKGFCCKTTLSKSEFYRRRALPEGDPNRIPDADGFLTDRTPVWRDETVDAYITGVLERSRAAKQVARRRFPHATPQGPQRELA